ncbi:protein EMBRYO DEFECTIVE 1674-like [Papaver somniferum]|uniref:protein EMBRYO DEFECTIVE 1674-like n=1 Tax=Papaver somniferum TaxID=3469 RepID=UPI000E6F6E4E|nr:protein EMBRYO DEFECTIVE 1674-like [Papaver somniferum]
MTTKFSASSKSPNNNTPPINNSSRFLQTVCLEDWWLIKSEDGNRLCIQGYTISENRARRVFSSAPITKKYSLTKLKTADGINILLGGAINRSRTLENGFSSEVCSRFLLGFPYDWEDVVGRCLGQESAAGRRSSGVREFKEHQ